MTENTTPAKAAKAPTPHVALPDSEPKDPSGYAVYDLTRGQYVTGVFGSKDAAEAAAVKVDGRKYTTRQV